MKFEEFEKKYLPIAEAIASQSQDPEISRQICKLAYSKLSTEERKNKKVASGTVHKIYFSQFYHEYKLRTETIARRLYQYLSIDTNQEWISVKDCLDKLLCVLKDFPPHLRVIFAYNLIAEQGKRNVIPARLLDTIIEKLLNVIKTAKNGKDMDCLYHELVKQLSEKILPIDQNEEWFSKLICYDRGVEDRIETWNFLSEYARLSKNRFARNTSLKRDTAARIRQIWNDNKDKIMLKLHPSDFLEPGKER